MENHRSRHERRHLVIGAAIIFYYVFYTTPRMMVQENIRAFEAIMPTAPAGSTSLEQNVIFFTLRELGTFANF